MARDARYVRIEVASSVTPFETHRRAAERVTHLVFAIYALCFFRLTQIANHWSEMRQWKHLALWPVAWMKRLPPGLGVDLLFVAALTTGLWVLLKPMSRWARVSFALCYVQALALSLSLGKISHSDHVSLWVAVLLCLAPHARASDLARARVRAGWLGTFAACQWMVALFYSLAGFWKIVGFLRTPPGSVSLLDFGGLGYSIGVKAGQTGSVSVMAAWLASYPWLSTLSVWLVLYFQLFSLLAVSRPKVHRVWGVGLIGFHLGALLGMEVPFLQTIPVLAVLWIGSPFCPERTTLKASLSELPLVKLALALVERLRHAHGEIRYPERSDSPA